MRRVAGLLCAIASGASFAGCDQSPVLIGAPTEAEFAFTNFSKRFYATIQVRERREDGSGTYETTPLLAPGAIHRQPFFQLLGVSCPSSLDFRLFLYQRVNETVPIGEDLTEAVSETPVVAGELLSIPACDLEPSVTFTVVNWDAAEGTARLKIAQGTRLIEPFLLDSDERFANADGVWEVAGVVAPLSSVAPPELAGAEPIAGRVTKSDGTAAADVVVVLRSRFRSTLGACYSCDRTAGTTCETPVDAACGYSEPIAFVVTGADGSFSFDRRPAGGYQVEFFSDEFSFRPVVMELETPIDAIQVIAE